MLDRRLRLAAERLGQGAEVPSPSKVGIERQTPVDERGAVVEVADNHDEGETRHAERHRVLPPQVGGAPRQPLGFGDLPRTVGHPAEPRRWR